MDDEIVVGINVKPDTNKNKVKNKKSKNKNLKSKNNAKNKNKNSESKNNVKIKNKSDKPKKKNVVRTQNNAKKYHKKKMIKNFCVIFLIIFIIIFILSSNLFNIKKINVTGNNKLTADTIISLSRLELYNNIFKFNKLLISNNIKENAYIEDVKISRRLPNTVKIEVKERNANFALAFAESYVYINNQGYILEFCTQKDDIPLIIGYKTDLSLLKTGERIILDDLKKMELVIKICDVIKNNDIDSSISKIDISNEKDYIVFLENDNKIIHIGDGIDLNTKVLYLKAILNATTDQKGEIFLNVDLNSDNPYFRPSSN